MAGDLDAGGLELGRGTHIAAAGDALRQALDDGLGDLGRVLGRRGHAAKKHMVPGVIVEGRDSQARGKFGAQLGKRLGQAQEHQAVDGNHTELFAREVEHRGIEAARARSPTGLERHDLAVKAATRQLGRKGLRTRPAHGARVARLGEQAQALAPRTHELLDKARHELAVVRRHEVDTVCRHIAIEEHKRHAPGGSGHGSVAAAAGIDHHAIHAGIDEPPQGLLLAGGIVGAHGRHERAAARGGSGGEALKHGARERIGDVGQDHTDQMRAVAPEVAGGGVGPVARALDDLGDAGARLLGHLTGTVVEIARDRGRAHARRLGDVLDAHLGHMSAPISFNPGKPHRPHAPCARERGTRPAIGHGTHG